MMQHWIKEKGQAMVEWAVVFPMFLLLTFVIIDFGWIGYQQLLFESAYQIAAWDFPLVVLNGAGIPISDQGIVDGTETLAGSYGRTAPGGVVILGDGAANRHPLGEGIKQYMLKSAPDLLNESKLKIEDASANFIIDEVPERYPKPSGGWDSYDMLQLRVSLDADIEYTIEPLTPLGKNILQDGKVVVKKKLLRERTERVIVKRRGEIPPVTP